MRLLKGGAERRSSGQGTFVRPRTGFGLYVFNWYIKAASCGAPRNRDRTPNPDGRGLRSPQLPGRDPAAAPPAEESRPEKSLQVLEKARNGLGTWRRADQPEAAGRGPRLRLGQRPDLTPLRAKVSGLEVTIARNMPRNPLKGLNPRPENPGTRAPLAGSARGVSETDPKSPALDGRFAAAKARPISARPQPPES